MKTFKIAVTLIVSTILILSVTSYSQTSCTNCSTIGCSKVSFTAIYNGNSIYSNNNIPWVQGMNVSVSMINANSTGPVLTWECTQYCPYGSFVNTINGYTAQSGYYWALYINGAYAKYGIDFQQVNAGDKISFVYTSYNQLTDKSGTKKLSSSLAKPKAQKRGAKSHQTLYFEHEESLKNK